MSTDSDKKETGYERMRRMRSEKVLEMRKQLKSLAENYHNDPDHIAITAYRMALDFAVGEIEGTEKLFEKAIKELPFSDPKYALREHNNQMNTLALLKKLLLDRKHEEL